MRLSSLKLSGFKSFADSTTLHFKANRTAVVGPNGCGKSNVIDAIRWVMGESSARQLRGGSMQDVIFTGTAKRKPVGVASVDHLDQLRSWLQDSPYDQLLELTPDLQGT